MRVLYAEAVYGEDEISAALNVLKNQPHSLMTSENVLKLESKVSDLFGHTYGIMVNSGSSANLLALQSLELPEKSWNKNFIYFAKITRWFAACNLFCKKILTK